MTPTDLGPHLVAAAIALAGAWLIHAVAWWVAAATLARLPSPPGATPLLGHARALASTAHHATLAAWADSLGGVFSMRIAWKHASHPHAIVVTDSALATEVLDAKKDVVDKGPIYAIFNQLNPNPHRGTIFTSPSDAHWAAVRKAVLPALSTRTVRASFPALAAATAAVGAWVAAAAAAGPGGVGADVDVDDACLRGSLDGAAAAAFGLRLGSVPPPGQDWINTQNLTPTILLTPWAAVARAGRAAVASKKTAALGLADSLLARGPPAEDDVSVAAQLLRVRDPATGLPLGRAILAGEAVTVLEAAFETTGHTAATTLALLARCPRAAERAAAELGAAGLLAGGGQGPRSLEWDDLARLPYLGACVKESMRLLPVVADGPMRVAKAPLALGGGAVRVPEGTLLIVPFYAAFRGKAWDRGDEFLPERWEHMDDTAGAAAPGAATKAPTPRLYTPFSRGPRSCVGAAMGSAMTLALVAAVLGGVTLAPAPGDTGPLEAKFEVRLTLQSRTGLRVRCTPRA